MLEYLCPVLVAVYAFSYFLPWFYVSYCVSVPNLAQKYSTSWALVTGGSSGIGKALVIALAHQHLNVVLVALDDELLSNTMKELKETFPSNTFMAIGIDFKVKVDYMSRIIQETKSLDIGLVFNNAGYIVTGFFDKSPLLVQLDNLECNVRASVQITHHFIQLMLTRGKGAVVFTSSASAFLPGPFAAMYAATKAFLSAFSSSIMIETQGRGVDVLAVHPSPIESRFYENTHKLDALAFAKWFAASPNVLPQEIFKSMGRMAWRDIGGFAIVARILMQLASFNAYMTIFASLAPYLPDFIKYTKTKPQSKTAKGASS